MVHQCVEVRYLENNIMRDGNVKWPENRGITYPLKICFDQLLWYNRDRRFHIADDQNDSRIQSGSKTRSVNPSQQHQDPTSSTRKTS